MYIYIHFNKNRKRAWADGSEAQNYLKTSSYMDFGLRSCKYESAEPLGLGPRIEGFRIWGLGLQLLRLQRRRLNDYQLGS